MTIYRLKQMESEVNLPRPVNPPKFKVELIECWNQGLFYKNMFRADKHNIDDEAIPVPAFWICILVILFAVFLLFVGALLFSK